MAGRIRSLAHVHVYKTEGFAPSSGEGCHAYILLDHAVTLWEYLYRTTNDTNRQYNGLDQGLGSPVASPMRNWGLISGAEGHSRE